MSIGNSWYDDGSEESGVTANIELQEGFLNKKIFEIFFEKILILRKVDSQPGRNFEINLQFTVPVINIEVWKFLAIPTHDASLWQFKQKPGYSYDTNLDFTINALSPTNDPAKIGSYILSKISQLKVF